MQVSDFDMSVRAVGPLAGGSREQQSAAAPGKSLPPRTEQNTATPPPDPVELDKAVSEINRQLQVKQHSVRLVTNAGASGTIIEVVDKTTDSVIRQIPSEAVVKLSDWWSENGLLSGEDTPALAVDETA